MARKAFVGSHAYWLISTRGNGYRRAAQALATAGRCCLSSPPGGGRLIDTDCACKSALEAGVLDTREILAQDRPGGVVLPQDRRAQVGARSLEETEIRRLVARAAA